MLQLLLLAVVASLQFQYVGMVDQPVDGRTVIMLFGKIWSQALNGWLAALS